MEGRENINTIILKLRCDFFTNAIHAALEGSKVGMLLSNGAEIIQVKATDIKRTSKEIVIKY